MIVIIDYGLGNVLAFANVYKRLNIEATVARNADEMRGATKLILPGVGAFDHAMARLEQSGMRATLDAMVLQEKVPVLGVCVGMQMMAGGSDEGQRLGLGWVPGRVRALKSSDDAARLPLPHMGWNDVRPTAGIRLFDQLQSAARFYFLHSFYFECKDSSHVAAEADYGVSFACAVHSANVYGVQFHPEKSHQYGTQLLKNFADL